jgi:hypothetical protein
MPLILYSIIRIYRAVVSTVRLVTDTETMRSLPWPHIRRLPREDRWIAFACFCLGVSTSALLVGVVVRGVFQLATFVAAVGLVASWLRPLVRRRRASA